MQLQASAAVWASSQKGPTGSPGQVRLWSIDDKRQAINEN